jgi:glycine dehydrogenase subunit 1
LPGWEVALQAPYFHEFVVRTPQPASEVNAKLLENGIIGGLDLAMVDPALDRHLLVCTTETSSRSTIDTIVKTLAA